MKRLLTVLATVLPLTAAGQAPAPTIVVDLVVLDATGKPITDLKLAEVEVVQDAERQEVASFERHATPGRYEVTYVPHSGKPGGVTVRILRPGSRVRGPQGDFLKPRVLPGASTLESQLERVLDAQAGAGDLDFRVAVLQFEARADGVHQTVAVEVPSSQLRLVEAEGQRRGRLQILARLKDADGRVVQRLALDRPLHSLGTARVGTSAFEQLVWTGHVHLPHGPYTAETLVFEPESGRAGTRVLPFQVTASPGTLHLSSVSLLQPRGFLFLAEPAPDDPLVVAGDPVMPTLDLALPAGTSAQVRFFVTIYTDPKTAAHPPALRLELRRDAAIVGSVLLKLPPAEPTGEVRYVGLLATRTLRAATYGLRLVAEQGTTSVHAETSFTLAPPTTTTPP